MSGIKKRLSKCYELSGKYVCQNKGTFLVHGELMNPFGKGLAKLNHAWVEVGKNIFDPVMNQTFPREVYMGLYSAEIHKRYSHRSALVLTLRHQNWGPWD